MRRHLAFCAEYSVQPPGLRITLLRDVIASLLWAGSPKIPLGKERVDMRRRYGWITTGLLLLDVLVFNMLFALAVVIRDGLATQIPHGRRRSADVRHFGSDGGENVPK